MDMDIHIQKVQVSYTFSDSAVHSTVYCILKNFLEDAFRPSLTSGTIRLLNSDRILVLRVSKVLCFNFLNYLPVHKPFFLFFIVHDCRIKYLRNVCNFYNQF